MSWVFTSAYSVLLVVKMIQEGCKHVHLLTFYHCWSVRTSAHYIYNLREPLCEGIIDWICSVTNFFLLSLSGDCLMHCSRIKEEVESYRQACFFDLALLNHFTSFKFRREAWFRQRFKWLVWRRVPSPISPLCLRVCKYLLFVWNFLWIFATLW